MKSTKDFRGKSGRHDSEEARRATKLAPVKKSGKDRIEIYDDDEEDILLDFEKKESVFDYFDDDEEDDM